MTNAELTAIEERRACAAKCPPGKRFIAKRRPPDLSINGPELPPGRWGVKVGDVWIAGMYAKKNQADAEFMAAAFDDVLALCAEVRKLRAQVKRYRGWLEMSDEAPGTVLARVVKEGPCCKGGVNEAPSCPRPAPPKGHNPPNLTGLAPDIGDQR